jgi:hypothetical protein
MARAEEVAASNGPAQARRPQIHQSQTQFRTLTGDRLKSRHGRSSRRYNQMLSAADTELNGAEPTKTR